jgi:phosphate transport system permease protein
MFKEKLIENFFLVIAFSSIFVLFLISIFLFIEGLPIFSKVGLFDFIFGMHWYPTHDIDPEYGIFPIIIGSVGVTLLATIIAVPISISIAIYMSEVTKPAIREVVKPMIEIIASLPSVVIGFFGLVVIAPNLITFFNLDSGNNMFNASLMLAFMAVPTMASIAEDAISSVPRALKEASYALGASKWQTIYHITIPAALSGIWTAIMLGISRILGETMVVLMVAGGAAMIPDSIFSSVRPLTSTIALEMGEVVHGGKHYQALFAMGIILFIITFVFNIIADYLSTKYKFENE